MAKAYTYSRATSKDSDDVSNSLPAQVKRTRQYYDLMLAERGIEWGGSVEDPSVSASKVRFDDRPGGRHLVSVLKRGDHLIFDRLDRMWRSVYDFERLHRWMDRRGITWHVVNQGGVSIDTSSSMGKAMVTIMVALAEVEAGMASERQLASVKMRREQGRLTGLAPTGMKAVERPVGGEIKKFLEWDKEKRALMAKVVEIIDNSTSDRDAHDTLCGLIAKKSGKPWSPKWIGKRPISESGMRSLYRREMQYRQLADEGFTTPKEVAAEIHARGWTNRSRKVDTDDHLPDHETLRTKKARAPRAEKKKPVSQIHRDLTQGQA